MHDAATNLAAAARALMDGGFEFYLASNQRMLLHFDATPLGVPVTQVDVLGPGSRDWDARDLMRTYHKVNGLAFGPNGIPMDEWVMIDLGLLPSAFLLITLPLTRLVALMHDETIKAEARTAIAALVDEVNRLGYSGPVPVAGYCASPTAEPGLWAGWSLCSIVPGRNLGWVAKGLGVAAYGASALVGVTQYDNRALPMHRAFGPMQVISATVDLHPVPHSFIYETDLAASDDAPAPPDYHVDARDAGAHRELQSKLDAGTHKLFVLPFEPSVERSKPLLIPIREVPAT